MYNFIIIKNLHISIFLFQVRFVQNHLWWQRRMKSHTVPQYRKEPCHLKTLKSPLYLLQTKLPTPFSSRKLAVTLRPGSHNDDLRTNQHKSVLPFYLTGKPHYRDTASFYLLCSWNLTLRICQQKNRPSVFKNFLRDRGNTSTYTAPNKWIRVKCRNLYNELRVVCIWM